jgi:hypothetical protein
MKHAETDPHKYIRPANPSPEWHRKWVERQLAAKLHGKPKWHIREQP